MISVNGINLPNKPLTNIELIDAVKRLNIPRFRGVFVRNDLPNRLRKNECGILNLDDISGGGTHWVAWYRKNEKNYYFDSYGVQPPEELRKYLNTVILYNTEKIQPKGEVFCGHICLYVLKRLSLVQNLQEIVNDLR